MEIDILCSLCKNKVFTIPEFFNVFDEEPFLDQIRNFKGVLFCEECKYKTKNGYRLESEII